MTALQGFTELHWKNVSVKGKDAVDFLHRVSTQELKKIAVGEIHPLTFTNRHGMLLSCGYVECVGAEEMRLFYQDVSDESSLVALLTSYRIMEKVQWKAAVPVHATYLWNEEAQTPEVPKGTAYFTCPYRKDSSFTLAFHSVNWDADFYSNVLEEQFEIVRCRYGIPRLGAELVAKRLPLEVGWGHGVSLSKGCYPGQETLTKFGHRGGFPRLLASFSAELAHDVLDPLSWRKKEISVLRNDQAVGTVTSITFASPRQIFGLGIFPTSITEPQNDVTPTLHLKFQEIKSPVSLKWIY